MIDGRGYKWTTSVGSSLAMPNPNGGNFPQGHGNESNGYAKIKYAASHDATGLSNLKISAGTLTPNFESGVYEYNLQLSTKEEEITITAEAIEEWSNILGTGTFLVPSGDSSYTISVVNYDGTIINYVINVNRPTSSYKFLDGIKINGIVYEDFNLVQHHRLHLVQPDGAPLHVVHQPPRGGDDDLRLFLQLVALLIVHGIIGLQPGHGIVRLAPEALLPQPPHLHDDQGEHDDAHR